MNALTFALLSAILSFKNKVLALQTSNTQYAPRYVASLYVLNCTIGMPAPMCNKLWVTCCDVDGDIINAAPIIYGHGDCNDQEGHCTCNYPQAVPCPTGENCIYTPLGLIPTVIPTGPATPTMARSTSSQVVPQITGPIIFGSLLDTTISALGTPSSSYAIYTSVQATSLTYSSQITLPVTGLPKPTGPVLASQVTLSVTASL